MENVRWKNHEFRINTKANNLLHKIIGYIDENKIAPIVRELSSLMGLKSEATIHQHLKRLNDSS